MKPVLAGQRPKTILVVEDEPLVALAQQAKLQAQGYEAVIAATGERAVEMACRDQEIDLVLMDIDLGAGIDGTVAAQRVLESRELPIVFLTSHSEKEMVEKVKGITRYGYVLKSSGEFVLMESIAMAFELFEARKEAERSRDHYKSIVRLSGEIVVRHGADQRWVFVNQVACDFWGKTREELLTQEYVSFVHPEDREATRLALRKMMEQHESVWGLINRQLTPGGYRTVEWNSAPIIDETGNVVGHQAVGRDVTERRRAEELLEEKEAAHEAILSSIGDVVAIIDADGVNRYKSPNVRTEFGWEAQELVGRDTFENVHPDDRRRTREVFDAVLAGPGERRDGKCRYRRADGTFRWIAFKAVNKLADPSIGGVLLSYRDVHEEQLVQDRLETTLRHLKVTFEAAPVGVILADSRNRIFDVNPTAARLFGYSREELIGLHGDELIHPDDLAGKPVREVMESAQAGPGLISIERRFRRKDGSYFHASVWVGGFDVPGYEASHMIQFQDISDRIAADRRVHELVEQKEILLREVHHRIKNDLHLIHSLLDLQAASTANDEVKRSLEEASSRIALIGQVYQHFEQSSEFHEVDAITIVSAIARKAQLNLDRGKIRVQTDVHTLRIPVRLSVSLGIIVNELVTNAIKYAFAPTSAETLQEPEIALGIGHDAGGTLWVTIRDNGAGFDDDVIRGTRRGYGLTIVGALVEQHSGELQLHNDHGAVATVRVPV